MIIVVIFIAGMYAQVAVPAEWWMAVGQYITNAWDLLFMSYQLP